jgi:hypothetical protein
LFDSQTSISFDNNNNNKLYRTRHLFELLKAPCKVHNMEPRSVILSAIADDRWGHASTFIPNPPTLLIQGGKTDPSGSLTATSLPNTGDTILIPLTNAFITSAPPVTLLTTSSAPQYAFHTLSTLRGDSTSWEVLAFGGDAGSTEPTQTQANSAWRGSVDAGKQTVDWTHEANGWGNQPMRRLYHSAAGPGSDGRVYISGGLKGDGSGITFSDVYTYDTETSTFNEMPSLPQGTYGHNSLLLPNGTLLLIGGVATSPVTGNPATVPLSNAFVMDTTAGAPAWETRSVRGHGPEARRGASLVLNDSGNRAFLFGGGDATLSSAFGDGWELDLDTASWKQVSQAGQGDFNADSGRQLI